MTPEFTKERDALRATNRQLADANAALTARLAEFERLQQVWLMSPEAAQRLQGYRDLAEKCAGFEAELDQFRPLVDVLRVERDEARALNAQLAAQVDDARRQRDECAAALRKATRACECSPESGCVDAQARATLHLMASEVADSVVDAVSRAANAAVAEAVAVTVERVTDLDLIVTRCGTEEMGVTTDEAVALITALLADGRVHNAWLHGRGGK